MGKKFDIWSKKILMPYKTTSKSRFWGIFVFWKILYSATIRDKHLISFSTGSKYPMPNMYCKKMKFLTPLGVLGPVNHKNDQNWASNISDPLLLGFCGNFKPYLLLNMWFSNEIMQNYHPGPSQRISLIDINFLKSVVDGTILKMRNIRTHGLEKFFKPKQKYAFA